MVLDGKRLSAAKWIIATGSSPAMPDLPGLAQVSCLTNRELFSLASLPESMIVLGGGAVACEMAQAFARLGCRVTVIQRGEQLLSGEDPDMAAMVQDRLRAEGVTLHLGTKVKNVRENHGLKEVAFTDQSGQERAETAQAVLVAMGRTPNLAGLDLENAGVAFNAKGLTVDARLRTSQPHIFGAGDVLGQWLFTHAAGYEASVALTNAVMRLPRKADYTFMPKVTFTDPELAGIGLTAKAAGPDARVLEESFADNDRALAEGHGLGKIKMILSEREKILGIHIFGPRAGDLLCEWVAALAGKVRLSALAQAVHPYPTLAEINKRLAGAVMAPKLFEGPVPKVLKAVFGLKGRACG
jgi:pyruvate/2-oxoglutarate dehydrogenase complex dihydrolipoamide dehydrogenase (E3) component